MAKVTGRKYKFGKVTVYDSRRWVLRRTPRLFYYRRNKDGSFTVSKRPVPKSKTNDALQKLWRGDMKRTARYVKGMGSCEMMTAIDVSKDTGYTWKDVLWAGAKGRMIFYRRPNKDPKYKHKTHELPYVNRHATARKYEGIPKVITPTVRVKRTSSEALTIDTFKILTANAKDWDNNDFWEPTPHPDRLTFHAQGLYLIQAEVEFTQHAAYDIHLSLEKNGSGFLSENVALGSPSYPPVVQVNIIEYMNSDDYMRVNTVVHATGISATLRYFWAVAITPEAIF